MKLSLVDFSFAAMDSTERRLDFCFAIELKQKPDLTELKKGAQLAFECFPKSALKIKKYKWIPDLKNWKMDVVYVNTVSELGESKIKFMESSIDLKNERSIKQTLFILDGQYVLMTKFHHALCDGVSALKWLQVQLTSERCVEPALELKSHLNSVSNNPFSFDSPSDGFAFVKDSIPTSGRSWITLDASVGSFTKLKHNSFTYNDLLTAVLIKSKREWNIFKGLRDKKIGIYMPFNIRKNAFSGFGNGASRIKIYDSKPEINDLDHLSNYIHNQVQWNKSNGTWLTPSAMRILKNLPRWLSVLILKYHSRKPTADLCSLLFSHLGNQKEFESLMSKILNLQIVAPIYKAYAMAVVAFTHNNNTRLTITFDQGIVSPSDVEIFKDLLANNLMKANNVIT